MDRIDLEKRIERFRIMDQLEIVDTVGKALRSYYTQPSLRGGFSDDGWPVIRRDDHVHAGGRGVPVPKVVEDLLHAQRTLISTIEALALHEKT